MSAVVSPLGPLIGDADEFYLSFAECPHDVLPEGYQDGNNADVQGEDHSGAFDRARTALSVLGNEPLIRAEPFWLAQPRRVIVPLPRTIKKGMGGSDVLAVERALAAAKFRGWGNFTNAFGQGVLAEVKALQHAHGIKATGVYGEATHRVLAPFFDAYGVELMTGYAARSAVQKAQHRALSAAMISFNFRALNHYTQGSLRWMMIANHIRQEAIPSQHATYSDCSAWYEWVYWDGGLPDPSLLNFTGGFTGTIGVNGKTVTDPSKAPIGAGFLYGNGEPWEHIQMSVGGENTIGDGSEAGPLYLPANYRSDLSVVKRFPGMSLA